MGLSSSIRSEVLKLADLAVVREGPLTVSDCFLFCVSRPEVSEMISDI